jgi:hypothetical protein
MIKWCNSVHWNSVVFLNAGRIHALCRAHWRAWMSYFHSGKNPEPPSKGGDLGRLCLDRCAFQFREDASYFWTKVPWAGRFDSFPPQPRCFVLSKFLPITCSPSATAT